MSETASQRTARLLNMSNAQLIMHAQDLTKQRDEALEYKSQYQVLLADMTERCHAAEKQRDELLLYKNLADEYGLSVFCDIAEITQQRDKLLEALYMSGHAYGCRKNAFGDKCTCGIDAVISSVKGCAE